MIIVTINDPLLEAQLEELCKANGLDGTEQVVEILNQAIFGDIAVSEPAPEPKKKAAKKSDA